MIEIGGYFELELNSGKTYHEGALELNTARNAFEYILRANKYSKVYLPYYTCEVMLEPITKLGLDYEFYSIDKNFAPIFNKKLKKYDAFVYTNYWGINQHIAKLLKSRFGNNLILDNSQAFYDIPLEGIDTFYSARKFFGVADGAYLYCHNKLDEDFEIDFSWHRMAHLLKRIDLSATKGYEDFKQNDYLLQNQPIKYMSRLTASILHSINYDRIAEKRRINFEFLHSKLKEINELKFDLDNISVPMVYPFLFKSENLKQELINNKFFIATYWSFVKNNASYGSFEEYLYKYLLPLPIDQRYDTRDIDLLLKFIESRIKI